MAANYPLNRGYTEDGGHDFARHTLLGGSRVGTRVSIFVWTSLISLALLGSGFFMLDKKTTQAELALVQAKTMTGLATKVERLAFKLRSSENSYLLSKEPKFKDIFDKTAREINKNLNALYGRSDTGTVRDHITTINDGLSQYTEEFAKMVNSKKELVITETDILARQMAVAAKTLEGMLVKMAGAAGGLRDVLARIRRHEKDFTLHGDARLRTEISKRGQEFDALVGSSTLSGEDKKELSDLMKLYQSHVAAYARARIANKNNVGRLNEIYAYMIPSVDSLAGFAGNQIKLMERNLNESVRITRIALVGSSGFLLILMAITGIILIRSLTLPIRESAAAAGKLVSGESDVEIPALGNADEIGELARALAIFGATLEEVVQLRGEAQLARAAAEEAEAELLAKTDTVADEKVEEMPAEEVKAAPIEVEAPAPAPAAETSPAQLPQPQEPEPRPSVPSNALTGPISTISQQVAQSSKNVTDAAYEAERTGALTQGLTEAVRRLSEVSKLLSGVEEQADFLVFKPGSKFPRDGDTPANLVVLSPESRSSSDQLGVGEEAVGKRFDIIRATNTQISRAIKDISELIGDAKETAHAIAANSSEQALKITSDLLKQSEYLRWMLNEQVGKLEKKPDDYDEDDESSEFGHNQPPSS